MKIKNILKTIWFEERKRGLRKRIFHQHKNSSDPEIIKIMEYLRENSERPLPLGMSPPYRWVADYRTEDVEVQTDAKTGMHFIVHNGHSVFFPRRFSESEIREAVNIGLMEQDSRSPHRYLGEGFDIDQDDIAVFIGASDGLFCLSLINRLSKAYLFEPCTDWHEPLKTTFAPWGDRVEVVPMAAGSKDTSEMVRLDSFFDEKTLPNYIQMDVDGVEIDVFSGASIVLKSSKKLRISVCTYHKRLDFPDFEVLLRGFGFTIGHSPGFFLIGVRMPYFRRGVMYAWRGC